MLKASRITIGSLIFLLGFVAAVFGKPIPENGALKEYYDNGKLRIYNHYKKGLIVRKRLYFRNGRRQLDHKYKNGVPLVMRTFYDNGKLKSFWTKKSGVTKHYFRNGKLRAVVDLQSGNLNSNLRSSYVVSGE